MWWYWIVGLLLLALCLLGLWYEITNQLGRRSERMQGADRPVDGCWDSQW